MHFSQFLAFFFAILMVGSGFVVLGVEDEVVAQEEKVQIDTSEMITINGYTFSINEGPDIPEQLTLNTVQEGESIYLVHMTDKISNQWARGLEKNGVEIVTYIHNNAYEVLMTPEEKAVVEKLPYVDWVGDYHPAYKISSEITKNTDKVTVNFLRTGNLRQAVEIARTHVDVLSEGYTNDGYVLRGSVIDYSSIENLASISEVQFISAYLEPHLDDESGMQVSGGFLWLNDPDNDPSTPYRDTGSYGAYVNHLGWTGNGVTIGVADTGMGDGTTPDAGHVDLAGRVIGGMDYGAGTWADGHGHGTHCTGLAAGNTYAGSGTTHTGFGPYYAGMGLAYDAELYSQKIFTDGGSASFPTDYWDILSDAYAAGVDVHSNSWSGGTYGYYDESSSRFDYGIRDADDTTGGNQMITVVSAASNSGPGSDTIQSPGTAKNIITVGSVENYWPDNADYGNMYDTNSEGDNPDTVSSFSSRGWTDDGRIKPDILAPGQATLSLRSPSASLDCLQGTYDLDDRYEWCSGTSMSTPTVAGGAAVIHQWYTAQHGVAPTPSMTKALLINTAIDVGTADIPNLNEGWGRMYLPTIMDPPAPFILKDTEPELTTNGETHSFTFSYSNPAEPLKISLAYVDRYAATGADPTLQNQVNLELETPTGTIYHGNAFSGGWSVTGNPSTTFDTDSDGYDDRNNVECVYLPSSSLETGQYTVRIIGTNIPADCDFDGTNDQDYSLVIYNALDVSSKGTIELDRNLYSGEDTVTITVGDTDLNTNVNVQTVDVTIESTTETGGETVTLTETGGDTSVFEGTIPISLTNSVGVLQVSHGDTITATYNDADDGTGSAAVVTDTALVDAAGPGSPGSLTVDWYGISNTTLLDDDVEGGDLGYTTGGDLESFAIRTLGSSSGSSSWDFGNGDYQESAGENSYLITPALNIPASISESYFSFYHWWDFESTDWDGGNVKLSTTGVSGTYNLITPASGQGYTGTLDTSYSNPLGGEQAFTNTGGWVKSTFDLSSYAGQTVHIKWDVGVDNYATTDAGWRIDDVLCYAIGSGGTTEDNLLNWTLSSDDGAGADDLTQYNIYRTDTSAGPWDATTFYTSVPPQTDQYYDAGAGEFDGTTWWYVVRGEDTLGNEDTNVNAVPEPSAGNSPPNAPFNPVPADTATGIDLNPTLSVDVTDPEGHTMNVTFYDASGPTQIGTTQTGIASGGTASVTWSGLAASTSYDWYAVADEGGLSTQSPTWTFTTLLGNQAPDAPFNPVPSDGATGVDLNPTLSVDVTDPDGDKMNVYFYDSSAGLIGSQNNVNSGGTASVTWSGLSENTLYEWYAVADDGEFSTPSLPAGTYWSFTTLDTTPPASPTGLTVEHWGASAVTSDISVSAMDAADTSGITVAEIQSNDGIQGSVGKNNDLQTESFDTTGASDPVTAASLVLEYSVDPGYTGSNSIEVSNDDGVSWLNTGITPADGDTDVVGTYDLFANGIDTVAEITALDVHFRNNDGAGADLVYFDYIWVNYTYGSGGGTDDNIVNWTASSDDGAGANDVSHYNLYRSDVNTGPWDATTLIDTVTADASASYSYIDSLKGLADTTYWWYVVRAEDVSANEDANSNGVQEPGEGGSPPTADAGPDQTGYVDYFASFDGSATTEPDGDAVSYQWDFTYDGNPQTLNGVNPTFNFQMPGDYEVTLTATDVDGSDTDTMWVNVTLLDQHIAYSAGWNLISLNVYVQGEPLDVVFADEWANINEIQYYDGVQKAWKIHRNNGPVWLSTLSTVDETMGLWVNFNAAGDGDLVVSGKVLTNTNIPLYAGWNLISYPASAPDTADSVLAGTGYDMLQKFDVGATYLITDMAGTENMVPGSGYWVHVTADTTCSVTY